MRSVLSVKVSEGQRTLLRWGAARAGAEESARVREASLDDALRTLRRELDVVALPPQSGGGLLRRELEEREAAHVSAMEWLSVPGRIERVVEACVELTSASRPEG